MQIRIKIPRVSRKVWKLIAGTRQANDLNTNQSSEPNAGQDKITPIITVGIMVVCILLAIYITSVILNGITVVQQTSIAAATPGAIYPPPDNTPFNSTMILFRLVFCIPMALIGWYILRIVIGGGRQ